MAFNRKTPLEKLKTKVTKLVAEKGFRKVGQEVKYKRNILFEYDEKSIRYGTLRCFVTKIDPIAEDDFSVSVVLSNENLPILSSNITNPPGPTRYMIDLFRQALEIDLNHIVLGSAKNRIRGKTLHITKELYDTIKKIWGEEGKDKNVRFFNRMVPFLKAEYSAEIKAKVSERDHDLLLKELLASGSINQADLLALAQKLEPGNFSDIVIKRQVHKQVEWLINTLQAIIDEPHLTTPLAKTLGHKHFGFLKTEIKGPEHLMEMILTKYGQYTIFGAPVLLNTDKYVVHKLGLPRSQFDIILINHLSDLEVVELKRPDAIVLDYDEGRAKFYPSKDLSIAVAQAERYISAVHKDNDEDYKIDSLKIREYINREIGGTMNVEIVRPSALIVMGSYQSLANDYNELSAKSKAKTTLENYTKNYLQAYKELKNSFRNISITSYSELLDSARTRLIIEKESDKAK